MSVRNASSLASGLWPFCTHGMSWKQHNHDAILDRWEASRVALLWMMFEAETAAKAHGLAGHDHRL